MEKLKVSMFFCGGAGINVFKTLVKVEHKLYEENNTVNLIDTSKSNLKGLNEYLNNTTIIGAEGSGKDRSKYADVMRQTLAAREFEFGDINILVGALSGGSGSIILPELAQRIFMMDKKVIMYTMCDTKSEIACKNTAATLLSLNKVANAGGYIPMVLTCNDAVGRKKVNDNLARKIQLTLIALLDENIEELDKSDKINVFSPTGRKGLYLSYQSDIMDEEDNLVGPGEFPLPAQLGGHTWHTLVDINPDGMASDARAIADFMGIDEEFYYVALQGADVPEALLTKLNMQISDYKAAKIASGVAAEKLSVDTVEHSSGLTLAVDDK